ncbi:ABC transporter ATP-binding protein [Pseudochelatococcus sp. B33]
MLELTSISKSFGGLKVLDDVSLKVPQGAIFGLIGPNGAGKTTVFNLVTGLIPPTKGTIAFGGTDLAGLPPHRITRLGIARTFQNIRIFKEMSLLENVLVGRHRHIDYGIVQMLFSLPDYRAQEAAAQARALELLDWVGLGAKAGEIADTLSYGEQRRLEIARALATEPRLLLLDEPVAGMNPSEKTDLMKVVRAINERGYTVFLIEHDMRFVMGLCEEVAVLNFGRIITSDRPEAVRRNHDVIEAYLGRDDDADTRETA